MKNASAILLISSLSLLAYGCTESANAGRGKTAASKPAKKDGGEASASSKPSKKDGGETAAASKPDKKDGGEAASVWGKGPLLRGEPLSAAEQISVAAVLAKPKKFEGKTVKVTGRVERVCAKKGCWMELVSEEGKVGCRIKFKDYAFFVPTDSIGAAAVVEGEVQISTLDKATADHYKSEGAKIVTNEKGEAVEIAMIASGVQLEK